MASGIGASSTQNRLSRLLCPAITRDLQVCSASVRTIGPAMRLVLDRSVVSVRCRDAFRRGTMTLVPISIIGGSSNPSGNARIGPIALADLGNDVLVEQEVHSNLAPCVGAAARIRQRRTSREDRSQNTLRDESEKWLFAGLCWPWVHVIAVRRCSGLRSGRATRSQAARCAFMRLISPGFSSLRAILRS